jgi:hypothetical protein
MSTPLPHAGDAVKAGFHVPYEVRPCAFGQGLFAAADIPSGALLWKIRALPYAAAAAAAAAAGDAVEAAAARAGCNVLSFASEDEARARLRELGARGGGGAAEVGGDGGDGGAAAAGRAAQAFWMDHVYMFAGQLNEILDDGKMWNHSEAPCTGLPPAGEAFCFESSYAIRDIRAGEELLDDYGLYEYPPWYDALCAEFGVDRSFVDRKAAPVKDEWKGYGAGAGAVAQ